MPTSRSRAAIRRPEASVSVRLESVRLSASLKVALTTGGGAESSAPGTGFERTRIA